MCFVNILATLDRSPAPMAVELGWVRCLGSTPRKHTGMAFAHSSGGGSIYGKWTLEVGGDLGWVQANGKGAWREADPVSTGKLLWGPCSSTGVEW